MKLSPEAIEEFRRIYKRAHGKEISIEKATHQANTLMRLVKVLLDKC